jgi:hypothetical protein
MPLYERINDLTAVRRYIESLDFTLIKDKLLSSKRPKWSREKLSFVEKQYRRYLYLWRKYEGKDLPPPVDVDEFWHNHILDTRNYFESCGNIFGYYRHHFPYFGLRGPKDERALHKAYEEANRLYLKEFKEEIYEFDPELDAT